MSQGIHFPSEIQRENHDQEISSEVLNFENMKAELLDILGDFLQILETDIFSFSHKNENELLDILLYTLPLEYKKRCALEIAKLSYHIPLNSNDNQVIIRTIQEYITNFVNDFISKYGYETKGRTLILTGEMYRNIFSNRKEMNVKERVSHIIELLSHGFVLKTRNNNLSRNENERYESNFKGELQNIKSINPNIIGYIILKSLKNDIEQSNPNSFDFFTSFLQNNYMFEGTLFGERFNRFFAKNIFTLSLDAQYKIIGTPDGENFLKQLLAYNGGNKQEKLSILVFVLEYHSGKFPQLSKEIYTECIKLIQEKVGVNGFLNQTEGISIKILIKIYDFYQENRISLDFDFDAEKAFEDYADIYSESDFEIFRSNSFGIYRGDLPFVYVKKSLQSHISRISENILLQRNTREQNEMKLRGLKRKGYLEKRKEKALKSGKNPLQSISPMDFSNISMSFYNGDLPDTFAYRQDDFSMSCMDIVDRKEFKEYYQIKKEKPAKDSENAQRLREDRKDMKIANDPLVIRQRLYSMMVSYILLSKYKPQVWPSVGEQLREKANHAHKKGTLNISRETDLLKNLPNGGTEEKTGTKPSLNWEGLGDNIPF